jgi:predicted metalloprotease with PDZ domain
MKLIRPLLGLGVAALMFASSHLSGQATTPRPATTSSANITNVRYELTFDATTAATRTVKVAMTFDVDGAGPVLLSLPVWTPGAYEITYFDRNVSRFDVTANGSAIKWDKTSYSKYRIEAAGAQNVRVAYDYRADTLDNAMAWSKPDFLLVNGTNVFLYPEAASLDYPATVTVHTQPAWRVVTAMTPAGAPNTFRENNYHDLVDMPFFIGVLDLDSAQANGKWNRLASYPAGTMNGSARNELLDQIGKLIGAEAKVFNELPWDRYTTMVIYDTSYGGGSALEHQRSHVGIYNPQFIGNPVLPLITGHEIFHAWNVKRMRPSEMWPYNYGDEQPTPWLWVSEGITDYYADLSMVRSGVTPDQLFYQSTSGKIANVDGVPPVALEDASLSNWIHPRDGTDAIYYPKGSLAGFMIDIMIRDATDNRRSLDNVMRDVYQAAYKNGRGFTFEDWWGAVSRAANGKSFADFYARYVDGREPYPWTSLLPLAGMRLHGDTLYEPRLGAGTAAAAGEGVRVVNVASGGAGEQAGLQPGDVILRLGDVKISNQDSFNEFRAKYSKAQQGSALPILVLRNGDRVTLQGRLRLVPHVDSRVEPDAAAGAKAVRIRNGILKGTVDP